MKKVKGNELGFIVSMLAIPMAGFFIFWVVVNFNSILLAFQKPVYGGDSEWSLVNFKLMFDAFVDKDSIILRALANTIKFFAVSLFLMVPLSFLMAFFLYKKVFMYKIFRFVFFLPSIISATILTTLFRYIVGPDGVLSVIYGMLFNSEMPLLLANSKYALGTIIAYCIWTGFGVNVVLFSSAMLRIPSEIIESAKIDGITTSKELVKIVLPLIWPTLSTVITLAIVNIFSSSGPILLFTGGDYNTYTISYWIFSQVYDKNAYEYSSAVGLFFTVIGLPIVFFTRWIVGKFGEAIEY